MITSRIMCWILMLTLMAGVQVANGREDASKQAALRTRAEEIFLSGFPNLSVPELAGLPYITRGNFKELPPARILGPIGKMLNGDDHIRKLTGATLLALYTGDSKPLRSLGASGPEDLDYFLSMVMAGLPEGPIGLAKGNWNRSDSIFYAGTSSIHELNLRFKTISTSDEFVGSLSLALRHTQDPDMRACLAAMLTCLGEKWAGPVLERELRAYPGFPEFQGKFPFTIVEVIGWSEDPSLLKTLKAIPIWSHSTATPLPFRVRFLAEARLRLNDRSAVQYVSKSALEWDLSHVLPPLLDRCGDPRGLRYLEKVLKEDDPETAAKVLGMISRPSCYSNLDLDHIFEDQIGLALTSPL